MRKYLAFILVCVLGLIGCSDKNMTGDEVIIPDSSVPGGGQLTLDKVLELSAKGEKLTWADFEEYAYEDIGSGLHIYCYDIDENYYLLIGGGNPQLEPVYIRLVSKADQDNSIDIRREDVKAFIEH